MGSLTDMLEDEESCISVTFKSKDKKHVDRLYAICTQLESYMPDRTVVFEKMLKHELKGEILQLWSLIDHVAAKLLEDNNLIKVDSVATGIAELIAMRCEGHPSIAKIHQEAFLHRFESKFYLSSKQLSEKLKAVYKSTSETGIDRIYQICSGLVYPKSSLCKMVVRCDIATYGKKIWGQFTEAVRSRLPESRDNKMPPQPSESDNIITVREFLASVPVKDFVSHLVILHSRCDAAGQLDKRTRQSIKPLFSRLYSLPLGEGQLTLTEILTYHMT